MVFTATKVKNSLVFAKIFSELPIFDPNEIAHDPLLDEAIYLIETTDPSYGDILVYLQAQWSPPLNSRQATVIASVTKCDTI